MQVPWQDRIVSTADVLKGKPRIKNTRIPASLVLGFLAAGYTNDQILAEYPDLVAEDIAACLDLARDLANVEDEEVDFTQEEIFAQLGQQPSLDDFIDEVERELSA